MLGLGPVELVVILLILVVLFGASRLRGLGGALGGSIREFKEAVRDEDDANAPQAPVKTATPVLPATTNTVPPAERVDQPEQRV